MMGGRQTTQSDSGMMISANDISTTVYIFLACTLSMRRARLDIYSVYHIDFGPSSENVLEVVYVDLCTVINVQYIPYL
jgi:hypothetical protein